MMNDTIIISYPFKEQVLNNPTKKSLCRFNTPEPTFLKLDKICQHLYPEDVIFLTKTQFENGNCFYLNPLTPNNTEK